VSKTNELQLSSDLTTITTEIKSYENIAGQSIFEIGRRLKWVKENDLAHGEFETWLSEIDMRPRQAQRFIKVATEFSKTSPVSHLGMSVLYEIATLPEEEKQKQIERVESGEKVSRREIEEIKRQLKAKEEIIADQENQLEENRKAQLELNSQLSKRPREVVTKTVEVEKAVTPPDYQDLKQQVADHQTQTAKLESDLARLKQERDEANQALLLEQGKVEDRDEKLKEYQDLEKLGRKTARLKRNSEYNAYRLMEDLRDFIINHQPLPNEEDTISNLSDEAKEKLLDTLNDMDSLTNTLRGLAQGRITMEGEILND
jgi:chromosome segregation ATPase